MSTVDMEDTVIAETEVKKRSKSRGREVVLVFEILSAKNPKSEKEKK